MLIQIIGIISNKEENKNHENNQDDIPSASSEVPDVSIRSSIYGLRPGKVIKMDFSSVNGGIDSTFPQSRKTVKRDISPDISETSFKDLSRNPKSKFVVIWNQLLNFSLTNSHFSYHLL